MRTIAFDEAIYRLVPMAVTEEMAEAAMFAAGERKSIGAKIAAAIATVPADLPGVVECSGEPCGYTVIGNGLQYFTHSAAVASQWPGAVPVFTHPPAQPDTEALQARSQNDQIEMDTLHRGLHLNNRTIREKQEEIDALQERIAELTRINIIEQSQSAHWRKNHDNMVAKAAMLSQRPDLPVDRIPAYLELERLQEQLAAQSGQEPFGWACWTDGTPMEAKYVASLLSYEPLAYPQRIKLYTTQPAPATSLTIMQAALDAAAIACRDTEVQHNKFGGQTYDDAPDTLEVAATNIRAIKPQTIIDAASGK